MPAWVFPRPVPAPENASSRGDATGGRAVAFPRPRGDGPARDQPFVRPAAPGTVTRPFP